MQAICNKFLFTNFQLSFIKIRNNLKIYVEILFIKENTSINVYSVYLATATTTTTAYCWLVCA